MKKKSFLVFIVIVLLRQTSLAQNIFSEKPGPGTFPIASASEKAVIITDPGDYPLVQKVAGLLQEDIRSVTGNHLSLIHSATKDHYQIIIGALGKSAIIDRLAGEKKIDASLICGKWEASLVKLVEKPFPGCQAALVIAGSDRRGTAYAVLELSRQMGVSPWYWWADVPVKKKSVLYVKSGTSLLDSPAVKYRGIFINDEAPALSGWCRETFGGFNHLFYEKVFELILRLKGNYLWPAMWGNAFYDDDSLNMKSADDYGIVIGTSHHEPLMRAHDEWRRYGHGAWNYDSNETILKKFWADGMRRIDHTETTVTVGMRGDGDKPMTEGTAISLLERIVRDQREIIAQTTGKPAEATPQVWALYKEVQDYYDKGMRVPDDVTLLLCDDNWGNIRRLPAPTDKPRKGGYGIYYHFDYVGDPRNYKWLNTNQIERTWEQMHLAYNYGVNKIWVVNVGDIKPMEFPISFFLDYAWNPRRWNEDNLSAFYTNWCTNQFGEKYAKQIGHIIQQYTQFNARRKPELLSPETYSLENYQEADQVVSAWHQLLAEAEKINAALPDAYRDAFFELVLHPVKACSNLNELYVTVAKNRWYASRQSTLANDFADKAKQLYINDSLISLEYNNQVAHGKWHHMMDQTHIGYTYWQQPPFNKMPELSYVTEKSSDTKDDPAPKLASRDARLLVPKRTTHPCFFEQDGIVSIAAAHYSTSIHGPQMAWKIIPNIGREDAGISSFPVTLDYQHFDRSNPRLEYEFYSYDSDACSINSYFSPTLNIHNAAEGLQYAISIDGEKPAIVSVNKDDSDKKTWEGWVASNIIIRKSMHHVSAPGRHTLTYWMISPALVLQKIVVDFGGLKESYLGPPETRSR